MYHEPDRSEERERGAKSDERDAVCRAIRRNARISFELEKVVEDGTFNPDEELTFTTSLSDAERLSAEATRRVDPVFSLGLALGAALERDIPEGSKQEELWRENEFSLPNEA